HPSPPAMVAPVAPSVVRPSRMAAPVPPPAPRPAPPAMVAPVSPPASPPASLPVPPPPAPINRCDAGGCIDAGGNRYGGGTGNVYLDRQGRPCVRSGDWLQCH